MLTAHSTQTLRRYTDLPALLHMLESRTITLLDPSTWEDTNDSYYIKKYKEKRELKTALALCMTEAKETFHHWRIFSNGTAGVSIDFDRTNLIAAFNAKDVIVKHVEYRKIREDRKQVSPPAVHDLPFLKRQAFGDEKEVRAFYESQEKVLKYLDINIELSMIRRITLSPWLHRRLKSATINSIKSINGCSGLIVRQTTLVNNSEWKKLGDKAT